MTSAVRLDGSQGEGGGQILRSALTLSAIIRRPFEIENIRAKRSKPGLRPQHLQAVRAAKAISSAEVRGDQPGSLVLRFRPGAIRPGEYAFRIPTAGAASLVLQTVALPLLLADAESRVTIVGGTHVPFAPCFEYLDRAWRPALGEMGAELDLRLAKCGFYPAGGGVLIARFPPVGTLHPVQWTHRGELSRIAIVSVVAKLPESVADRQAKQAKRRLAARGFEKLVKEPFLHVRPAPSPGTMLGLTVEFASGGTFFFSLGAKGKPAETVADEAVEQMLSFLDSGERPVDPHLSDQLLLPAALAEGRSTYRTTRVTAHLLTNAAVVRRFVERSIRVEGELDEPGTVVVE